MSRRTPTKTTAPTPTRGRTPDRAPATSAWRPRALAGGLALLAVGGLFLAFRNGQPDAAGPGHKSAYQVGQPAAGGTAPAFTLPASTGRPVSLSDYRGKNVLLFFQEGIGCQPCWDQIRDLEKDTTKLHAAGIDDVVSITTSPADLVAQKVRDDRLTTPVLSDPDLKVSKSYSANSFGMMGDSRDGHSFMLIGPDGKLKWRADYGGAPNYTMYLPVDRMLIDMRQMMAGGSMMGGGQPGARQTP